MSRKFFDALLGIILTFFKIEGLSHYSNGQDA